MSGESSMTSVAITPKCLCDGRIEVRQRDQGTGLNPGHLDAAFIAGQSRAAAVSMLLACAARSRTRSTRRGRRKDQFARVPPRGDPLRTPSRRAGIGRAALPSPDIAVRHESKLQLHGFGNEHGIEHGIARNRAWPRRTPMESASATAGSRPGGATRRRRWSLGTKKGGRRRPPFSSENLASYSFARNLRSQPDMPPFALRNATRSLGATPCWRAKRNPFTQRRVSTPGGVRTLRMAVSG